MTPKVIYKLRRFHCGILPLNGKQHYSRNDSLQTTIRFIYYKRFHNVLQMIRSLRSGHCRDKIYIESWWVQRIY